MTDTTSDENVNGFSPSDTQDDAPLIFIPVRPQRLAVTPEQMLAWIRARTPQHDGRLYFRVSEIAESFNGTELFYHVVMAMFRQGMVEIERWRLEKLGPRKPKPTGKDSHKTAPSPWDQAELLYVLKPLRLCSPLRFECYAETPTPQRALTAEERELIWLQWEQRCAYCEKPLTLRDMAVDHNVPRSRGGSNELSNLVCSCQTCNTVKGARTALEYIRYLDEVEG